MQGERLGYEVFSRQRSHSRHPELDPACGVDAEGVSRVGRLRPTHELCASARVQRCSYPDLAEHHGASRPCSGEMMFAHPAAFLEAVSTSDGFVVARRHELGCRRSSAKKIKK